jgi:acyl transferase domain-containing protein/NADP-dependent 3-hydroxy acid dehydrogenase YdfG
MNRDGEATQPVRTMPIAVVGVSSIFPGTTSTAAFWRDILEGKDRLTEVPRTHWLRDDYFDARAGTPDKIYSTRGGFLPEVSFSPLEFGLPPNSLPATDTAQLLALVVAKRVLAEATRGRYESMDRSRMSVVLGVASATELVGHMSGRLQLPIVDHAMRTAGLREDEVAKVHEVLAGCYVPWQESTFPGLLGNVVAGRIANRLDLGGTNVVVDAACASSLAAVDIGVNELAARHSDLVIVGGVDTLNDILMFMCFAQTGALSLTGDCRPFSSEADGTMLGEGIGMLVLKRLDDAERDGDSIYAVIRGVGSSSDGRAKSIYAPAAAGQALALERAYDRAGYGAETVELIEAHGTATKAGDAAEFEALKKVFEAAGARRQTCALGSVKGQIGHTKAAAGSAGMIKAVLSLHHKVLPGSIKAKAPNPALGIEESPFYLNTETRPWVRGADHPRRASVSALGFGGTNFHVAVEEYGGPAPHPGRVWATPTDLIVLGASDARALAALCRATAEQCRASATLVHVARRSQLAFDATSPARCALVVTSESDASDKLAAAAESLEKANGSVAAPRGVHVSLAPATGPVALLFPGQGSQYVGMGKDLAVHFEDARSVWDRAAALPGTGEEGPISQRVYPVPVFTEDARRAQEAELTATQWAQPGLAATSLSILRVLERVGLHASCVGGHSLGEVTALAAAGVLDESAALAVARRRGELMARAGETGGAMIAVTTDRPAIERLLASWGSDVVVANHNAPQQVVLSGSTASIEDVERRLQASKISAIRLQVSTAFHCPVVAPSCAPFRAFLDGVEVRPQSVPVYSNVTATTYPTDAGATRDQLATAIARPVRFVEQIEAMYAAGARTFIEVGPEGVLTKLVGRCLEGRPHVAIATDQRGKHGMTALWEALGRLSVAGVPLRLERLWDGVALPEEPSASTAPKLTVQLTGANYGKPYPPVASANGSRLAASGALPSPPRPSVHKPVTETSVTMSKTNGTHPNGHSSSNGTATHAVAPPPQQLAPFSHPAPQLAAAPTATLVDPGAWVRAVQELQAPAIAAQMEYQRLMAESHAAFLRAMEVSYTGLGQFAPAPQPMAMMPAPAFAHGPAYSNGGPSTMAPAIESAIPMHTRSAVAPTPHAAPTAAPTPAAPPRAAVAAPAAPAALTDLVPLVLGIVAEKTGYPAEMIELGMDLEGELGIDSIKRVEILSVLRERAPGLLDADTSRMLTLRTLGQMIEFLRPGELTRAPGATPAAAPAAAAPVAAATPVARPAPPAAPRSLEVSRFAVRAVPSPAPTAGAHPLAATGTVAVTPDGGGVAQALVARLRASGVTATVAPTVPADAGAVVFLGGLRPVAGIDDALAVNREALSAARVVAERFREHGGTLITVQDTGGDFGLGGATGDRAWLGGVAALAKTAAEEWPKGAARAIDIERGGRSDEAVAEALAAELLRGGGASEREVGLRADGVRQSIAAVAEAAPLASAHNVEKGAVFVVSGGARGVTAAALVALARAAQPRFLLLGRTALSDEPAPFVGVTGDAELKRAALDAAKRSGAASSPKEIARLVDHVVACREIRETLRLLTAAGSTARYVAVDVRDAAAVAPVLEDTRRAWGPIRGLVHGAGVLSDSLIDKKTDAQFDRVFDTKVLGLRALLDATRSDSLGWLCMFSSVAARAGNAGQADYAMANDVLNKVAAIEARSRGERCRVVSIGWGPWEGGMVTPALQKHFEARGVQLLSQEAGAAAFVRELGGRGDVEIVIAGDANPSLGKRPSELRAEIFVEERTYPQLASHRIQGKTVLPVVMAIEWFAGLVEPLRGEQPAIDLVDLRVVRGVHLAGYGAAGDRFQLVGRPVDAGAPGAGIASGGTMALELRDQGGALRYAATLSGPSATSSTNGAHDDVLGTSRTMSELYGPSTLFHGPDFQVIRSVDSMSQNGARATLATTHDVGWPTNGWHTDPAALDGALQLAILFGLQGGGATTLPMRIARVVLPAKQQAAAGPVRCQLTQRHRSPERLLCDLSLTRGDGSKLADLIGVEMFAVPSGTTA